ncbi:MAG: hypothetical protein JWM99_2781, partial [Verrucomicrobiales bacterium]|nr:hypothetical protein [Verrucomicrobiales bacterium]
AQVIANIGLTAPILFSSGREDTHLYSSIVSVFAIRDRADPL